RQLHRQLVALAPSRKDRRLQPFAGLGTTGVRDLVERLPVARTRHPPHAAVALEALEGRVDLADVERPGAVRPLLDLRMQPGAVGRRQLEDGQQALSKTHRWFPLSAAGLSYIASMYSSGMYCKRAARGR